MLYLTGIHDARQLQRFDPAAWPGTRRRIAIDLIDDIDRMGNTAVRVALLERIVDVRGAFKRTYPDRFAAFDRMVIEQWRAEKLVARPVHVLDAAVSDGVASLPLFDSFIAETGGELRFTATDLDGRYVRLRRLEAPHRRVILGAGEGIVQIILPPFLFTHRESRYLFPLNRLMRPSAERFARRLVADWKTGSGDVDAEEFLLLAPELRRRLESDKRLGFCAWDILEPWEGEKAHVVRAMNVLNHGYFDAEQMRRVVRNLFDALADGGLIAMGSNEDAGTPVDGIVSRKRGGKLVIVATSGNGFRAPDAIAPLLAAAS